MSVIRLTGIDHDDPQPVRDLTDPTRQQDPFDTQEEAERMVDELFARSAEKTMSSPRGFRNLEALERRLAEIEGRLADLGKRWGDLADGYAKLYWAHETGTRCPTLVHPASIAPRGRTVSFEDFERDLDAPAPTPPEVKAALGEAERLLAKYETPPDSRVEEDGG